MHMENYLQNNRIDNHVFHHQIMYTNMMMINDSFFFLIISFLRIDYYTFLGFLKKSQEYYHLTFMKYLRI
jgi:hypothetical protein